MQFNAGDLVVVTDPLSSVYGMSGWARTCPHHVNLIEVVFPGDKIAHFTTKELSKVVTPDDLERIVAAADFAGRLSQYKEELLADLRLDDL